MRGHIPQTFEYRKFSKVPINLIYDNNTGKYYRRNRKTNKFVKIPKMEYA